MRYENDTIPEYIHILNKNGMAQLVEVLLDPTVYTKEKQRLNVTAMSRKLGLRTTQCKALLNKAQDILLRNEIYIGG